jgi:hypothetical protein
MIPHSFSELSLTFKPLLRNRTPTCQRHFRRRFSNPLRCSRLPHQLPIGLVLLYGATRAFFCPPRLFIARLARYHHLCQCCHPNLWNLVRESGALKIVVAHAVSSAVLAWLAPRHDADVVDEVMLHRHCFSALIGVPSPTFTINHSSCSLSLSVSPIRLEDVSSSALRNALLQFAHAGTAALRLGHLAAYASSPSSALPFSVKSLICFARSQLLALCQVRARSITL